MARAGDRGKMKKKEIDWIALRAPKWFHDCRNGGSVVGVASLSHAVQPPVKSIVTMFSKLGLRATYRSAVLAIIFCLLSGDLFAVATTTPKKKKRAHASAKSVNLTRVSATRRVRHRRVAYSPWTEPTFA